jgi:hypothetical protein
MPYQVSKVKGGYKVKSPNHPQGFSKAPQTARQAHIQQWIIQKSTGEDASGKKVAKPSQKIGVKRSKK